MRVEQRRLLLWASRFRQVLFDGLWLFNRPCGLPGRFDFFLGTWELPCVFVRELSLPRNEFRPPEKSEMRRRGTFTATRAKL